VVCGASPFPPTLALSLFCLAGRFFLNLPRASVAGAPELAIEREPYAARQSQRLIDVLAVTVAPRTGHRPHNRTRRLQRPGGRYLGALIGNVSPAALTVRQITLQARVVCPGRPNRNVDGISKVALTSREVPDSVKLRTVHGSTAFFPRIIVPDLRARRRGVFRRSAIARK
jgi:hypothetical protein